MAKGGDTVTGRWPVALYDVHGKRVPPGSLATVTKAKAAELDGRFPRVADAAADSASEAKD